MSTAAPSHSDYCVFHRAGYGFAISTHLAKEVIESRSLTPVPYAPPELLGALNVRGEVVPLVSLDSFLHVPGRTLARGDSILVLASGDLRFAAVVDRVAAVKHLAPWEIRRDVEGEPPPGDMVRGYATAGDERLTVLDGETLIGAVVHQVAEGFRRHPVAERAAPAPIAGPEEED